MDKMLYMGISGSFLIAAIICFRHFFSQQIPKRFLVLLWIFAIARLLLPISIPIRMPADYCWNITETSVSQQIGRSSHYESPAANQPVYPDSAKKAQITASIPETSFWIKYILITLWITIAIFLAIRISIKHIRSCRLYNMSLPICDERALKWMQAHHNIRNVTLRKSELIKSPLTYGIIHPVILLPSEINLSEEEFLCIMEHEWTHIRRWDILVKYLLYLTVCIYWFHPMIWIMAILLNRDIEMACDEEVIKRYPNHFKKTYALILIRLAQENCQNSIWPVKACFARHSEIEERIHVIMKAKKYSWKAAALAVGMTCCTITAFTVSAQGTPKEAAVKTSSAQPAKNETAKNKKNVAAEATEADKTTALDGQSAKQEQIVKLAKKYLGAPYKFGGADLSSGVDSPGFIKAIYGLAGIELPADINELADNNIEIPLTELSAGDVVIYSGTDPKLFHAAIYDGNGQVIHASNMREGVKISDLNYREISMAIRILP